MSKGSELLKKRWLGRKSEQDREQKEKKLVKSMDSLVELARHSILSILNGSESFDEYIKKEVKKEWNKTDFDKIKKTWSDLESGIRITLFVNNEFRGSYGTLKAEKNVYDDTITYAKKASFEDNRFPPLNWKEFKKLLIEVTLIDEEEYPIEYKDPLELCMILEKDKEKGVLVRHPKGKFAYELPDTWDLIPDPAMFLTTICGNAGLPASAWRGEKRLWPQKIKDKKRNLYTGEVIQPETFSGVEIYHLKVISACGNGKS